MLIVADDLGWSDVGYHGSAIQTPTLDRLANEGVRLDHFYVFATCTPARAALLTGRHPMSIGLPSGILSDVTDAGLPAEERTLAEALRDVGYRTAICGKWHLGRAWRAFLPTNQGFEHQYGCYTASVDYYTKRHGNEPDWWRDDKPIQEDGYATDLIAREAISLINADDPRPLFLYIPFTAPHKPLRSPPQYTAMYDGTPLEGRRIYAGVVTCMDDAIGRIVAALDARSMLDNTLLVFCSDNGGADYGAANNGPFRGGKKSYYEGGVVSPAFVYWRGRLQPRLIDTPMRLIDLYPTLVTLAGGSLEQPRPIDGADVWPTISEGVAPPFDEYFYSASPVSGALRRGDWKLVLNYTRDPPEAELYNLATDPAEREDVAAQHAEEVAALTKRLDELRAGAAPLLHAQKPSTTKAKPDSRLAARALSQDFERFCREWRDGKWPADGPEFAEQMDQFAEDFEFTGVDGTKLNREDWMERLWQARGADEGRGVESRVRGIEVRVLELGGFEVAYQRFRHDGDDEQTLRITTEFRTRGENESELEFVRIRETPAPSSGERKPPK